MAGSNGNGPTVVVQEAPSNGLGTAGFVVSLVGFVLSCGLLCPIGLLLSLVALTKRPRGMAIAGVVIGFIGSGWLILGGFAMLVGILGLAVVANSASIDLEVTAALQRIGEVRAETGEFPMSAAEIEDVMTDGLRYVRTGDGYVLTHRGIDGEFNTDDDIVREVR